MHDAPRRLDPQKMDIAAAAIRLGCETRQVGYCARCQGYTVKYGANAQPVCPACRAEQTSAKR